MEQSLENLLRDLELYLEENWNGSDQTETGSSSEKEPAIKSSPAQKEEGILIW